MKEDVGKFYIFIRNVRICKYYQYQQKEDLRPENRTEMQMLKELGLSRIK